MIGQIGKMKILIDLDVITVGIWEKKDYRKRIAHELMKRIEKKEFEIVSSVSLLDLVEKWDNKELANAIREFYIQNTTIFINEAQIIERLNAKNIDVNKLMDNLQKINIKREDIILILCCIVEDCKLITFNRTHLKNNEKKIQEVLKKYKLSIQIKYPNEV